VKKLKIYQHLAKLLARVHCIVFLTHMWLNVMWPKKSSNVLVHTGKQVSFYKCFSISVTLTAMFQEVKNTAYLYDKSSNAGAAVAARHKADSDDSTWSWCRWRQDSSLRIDLELSWLAIRYEVRMVRHLTTVIIIIIIIVINARYSRGLPSQTA